jgi:hypothetical protein
MESKETYPELCSRLLEEDLLYEDLPGYRICRQRRGTTVVSHFLLAVCLNLP